MTDAPRLTRRQALAATAAAPLAAGVTVTATPGLAQGAANRPTHSAFRLGEFTVVTLLDGTGVSENPQQAFGTNVSAEEFARVSAENFIPSDRTQGFFTPTLVDTGSQVILFDTGLGRGGIQSALAEAGYAPDDVDTVVLTHMHPDHIGGMNADGAETFANASYVAGAAEYSFWTGDGAGNRVGEAVAAKVTPYAERTTFIDPGAEVAPGITAVGAFGHTPGHMCFRIESGGEGLMLTGDLANHHVWSVAYPDWEVRFDVDKAGAAAARRDVLGMIAAERLPFIGYHLPFPAVGYVETRGDGFRYVPATYQLRLKG